MFLTDSVCLSSSFTSYLLNANNDTLENRPTSKKSYSSPRTSLSPTSTLLLRINPELRTLLLLVMSRLKETRGIGKRHRFGIYWAWVERERI